MTIIKKRLKYYANYQMWHREIKWANDVGKAALTDLLNADLPQNFHLLKKKMQYLWSAIKQSVVKWGMPM